MQFIWTGNIHTKISLSSKLCFKYNTASFVYLCTQNIFVFYCKNKLFLVFKRKLLDHVLIIHISQSLVDLKLRGRKENGGDVADYDESSATSNGSSLLLVILVALCLYLHHHPQMRTLHPAWDLPTTVLHAIARVIRSSSHHRDFVHPLVKPSLRDFRRGWISSRTALTTLNLTIE